MTQPWALWKSMVKCKKLFYTVTILFKFKLCTPILVQVYINQWTILVTLWFFGGWKYNIVLSKWISCFWIQFMCVYHFLIELLYNIDLKRDGFLLKNESVIINLVIEEKIRIFHTHISLLNKADLRCIKSTDFLWPVSKV